MIKNSRCMIIAAMPRQAAELKTIFSEQPESIRRKLESPPRLRASGWDLPTLAQAKILRGELIRVVERNRMIVDLYRDGTLILGGGRFIGISWHGLTRLIRISIRWQ